jgi:hypothetical protein
MSRDQDTGTGIRLPATLITSPTRKGDSIFDDSFGTHLTRDVMDEIAPNAEHESIATSLEVEQLDKNLSVLPLNLSIVARASLIKEHL